MELACPLFIHPFLYLILGNSFFIQILNNNNRQFSPLFKYFSASMAAIHPLAAATTACW